MAGPRPRGFRGRRLAAALCAGLWGLLPTPGAAVEEGEAWARLAAVRASLATGARSAEFVQTYLPSGFSIGERESGRLALALPGCMRWDYREPYEKSFLLCDDLVHTWNGGESTGRRHRIEAADQPGLDLLRLGVEDLATRYDGRVVEGEEGTVEVVLVPHDPSSGVVEARFEIDAARSELRGLSYHDLEGNATRFELSDFRPLPGGDLFAPPSEIDWLDE